MSEPRRASPSKRARSIRPWSSTVLSQHGTSDVFATYGTAGTQLRIMFFRGPGGERFEVVQDNIKAL